MNYRKKLPKVQLHQQRQLEFKADQTNTKKLKLKMELSEDQQDSQE